MEKNKIQKNIKENQKKLCKINNKQRGITLIALVVTIVVLLILAGVSLSIALSNNGVISKAKDAKGQTISGKEKEVVEMAWASVWVDSYSYDEPLLLENFQNELDRMLGEGKALVMPNMGSLKVEFLETGNEYSIDETGISKVQELAETFSEIVTEDREYVDSEGRRAIIPKGFAVGTSENINKISNGLVIQDENGNQFVWIPSSKYTGNGFYVGRYEAGSENERTENTTINTVPVVQRDKFAYNYISYNEAVSQCKLMYESLDSVNSELMSLQDMNAMYDFFNNNNLWPSNIPGNLYESAFVAKRGKYAMINDDAQVPYSPYYAGDTQLYRAVKGTFIKPYNAQAIFTTGASDQSRIGNVFDVIGNVMEWCDAGLTGTYKAVYGGAFVKYYRNSARSANVGGNDYQIFESHSEIIPLRNENKIIFAGFRPVLYINEGNYNL